MCSVGSREAYLPGNAGFDFYLGIPYSADMGDARATPCSSAQRHTRTIQGAEYGQQSGDRSGAPPDKASLFLPLVHQSPGLEHSNTTVLEQPLDFSTLGQKYNTFALDFVTQHKAVPFFLYFPFSHVHATSGIQPQEQYAGCAFQNATERGLFGDALAEVDWMVGNVGTQVAPTPPLIAGASSLTEIACGSVGGEA